jgi:putative nucleotidyltransferase with HDIG domain
MSLSTPARGALEFKIPPMPHTLLRAVELMNADGDVNAVVALVESDPAVAARVLRISNSAFAGQRAEIVTIRRAVIVLGPSAVLGLVMSMGMMEMRGAFDDQTATPFLEVVRHSIMTAVVARMMAADAGQSGDEQAFAFAAGLLHDLGKLVLLYTSPTQAAPVYRKGLFAGAAIDEEERALDTNHLRMGAAAANRLKLPDEMHEVMLSHAMQGEKELPIVALVRNANSIAHFVETRGEGDGAAPEDLMIWLERAAEIERYVDAVV